MASLKPTQEELQNRARREAWMLATVKEMLTSGGMKDVTAKVHGCLITAKHPGLGKTYQITVEEI